jgi:type II secretory pathway component HofQ
MKPQRAAALLAAFAVLAAAEALAAPAAEVYRAKHRTAEELLPYAEATLGGEGRAIADAGTNSVVLISERRDLLASALALLATQDRGLRTVVLEYESKSASELEAQGIRVRWGVDSGVLRVGNLLVPPDSARVVIAPSGRSERGTSSFAGSVRILEGGAGRIATGRSVPVTTRQRYGKTTTLVAADSGLEARARVLGDGRVQLELRPFEGRFQSDGSIATADAATTLVVEPGKTVVIGGIEGSRGAASLDAFSGAEQQATHDERVLTITARVE